MDPDPEHCLGIHARIKKVEIGIYLGFAGRSRPG